MVPDGKDKKINILIVEDSPTQAEQLKFLLENAGYGVRVAGNGKEALSVLETGQTDLILSDIVMPEMDGYELCRTIKKDERFRKIPVILVTVLFDPQDVIRGLECGANNFITKPYAEKYLLSRIQVVLANTFIDDTESAQMGMEISFAGKKHYLTSSRLQILNMLLSTYETAVQKNQDLTEAKNKLRQVNEHLEDLVLERTAELEKTNSQLTGEIEIRKKAEEGLRRKTRAYQVISECNQTLVRTLIEQDLINTICTILVTSGGYRCAWVGYANDDESKTVRPVAQFGFEKDHLANLRISWKKGHGGNGPTGMAIRNKKPVVIHDIRSHPDCGSWIAESIRREYSTVAAFPLSIKGQAAGALTIYSGDTDAFDADEIQLLSEMAEDLAYGIETIRTRKAHEKAEQDLKASEIRYRRLFEAAKDGILLLDAETGIIVDVNPFMVEMLGLAYNKYVGKNFWDIGIFRDIASSREKFEELRRQGYVRYEDLPVKTADGERREVEFVSNVYVVNRKKVIQCNIRDITERKKAEEALRAAYEQITASEEELRQQYSALAEKDQAIQALNRDLEKRVEERTGELRKANEELSNAQEELREQLAELAERDVQLAGSEERFRRAFDDATIGMAMVSPEGRFLRVNPEFSRMLGYSPEELLAMNFRDITRPEDLNESDAQVSAVNAGTQDIIRMEKRYLHKDGRVVWVFVNSILLRDPDGSPLHFITQVQDITGQKKMTEQIAASLAEKEILLKEIHHRVKNNLQIIASILNLQIRKIGEPTTIEALKDCQSRVRSMALVHEHLYRGRDLSHIELGNYIRALGTVLFNSYDARERGVMFDLDIRDIHVDTNTAIPMGLIVSELITNSLKYAFREKKDGRLSIHATEVADALTFIVADNGVGMPPEITLENQATLGLQLVSTLTEQLNGSVTIDRSEGTKFTFTFPRLVEQKTPEDARK